VPATPPRAFLATACPPSSGKRGLPRSRSSASPGPWTSSGGRRSWSFSGGRTPPHLDADGFQLAVGCGQDGEREERGEGPQEGVGEGEG